MEPKDIFKKTNDEWSFVKDEVIDRISGLAIDCPECENIIHSDEQYQCMTCGGGGQIMVRAWIENQLKELNHERQSGRYFKRH